MARVVLGVGASHSTLMNTHWDKVVHTDRAERFRDALREARDEIAAAEPDLAIIVGSNHFRGFWLDMIPPFTLGVGEVIGSGEAKTPSGPQKVAPEFAQRLAEDLVERGTEVAISARLQIDHGQTHAIQYLLDDLAVPVVPLVVNVFAAPLPRTDRCAELGRNIALAVAALPEDLRVVVIASGGLSHQLPWPDDWRAPEGEDEEFLVEAWLNGRGDWESYDGRRREIITAARPVLFPEFDETFLADLERGQLRKYTSWTTEEIGKAAGNGGQELRTWLVMAAALGFAPGRALAYSPMPEWLTGMGVAVIRP
ncbi:catechol 1,2-dioxygenase [Amycolatopsis australiensis]|uniref:2,3-dihydroxyphenylpropionate 1,2-dioxygenase n=1 Tax=Amycolatopsis australiensis TaxID=546364 RepID=A0A1K1S374_9PSEU|nr:catechol 1,2-dioxygenase [Amycolatopsis australiensis]SFW78548.1 2,3-dihydroxyphenylpropionate 1,2-dioxygenase [Amycolatopsis australiensis]